MTESNYLYLYCFLFVAFLLAPLMTKCFFLVKSKAYSDVHKASLIALFCGALLNLNYLAVVWPLFCAYGFFLYLKGHHKFIFSVNSVAGCIPFIFSLISSVWFVAGINDMHLLGYNRAWSFYAALHGIFLGWIFVGCLAFLSKKEKGNNVYLWGCYLSFLLFLFVAFGINGVPHIKYIGVIGLSFMMPFLIGCYTFNLRKKSKLSMSFSLISFFSIILSMSLAILHEFWESFPKTVSGLSTMVISHGLMNAFFSIPCFFLAIKLEQNECSGKMRSRENVVLFDELCILCSRSVTLLIRIDNARKLKYSSLQGKFAQTLQRSTRSNHGESMIFWSNGIIYEKADAIICILLKLGGIYKIIGFTLKIFPVFILNILYDLIARNRYRIFGKNSVCKTPVRGIEDLFLP